MATFQISTDIRTRNHGSTPLAEAAYARPRAEMLAPFVGYGSTATFTAIGEGSTLTNNNMTITRKINLQQYLTQQVKNAWLSLKGRNSHQPLSIRENNALNKVIDATGCVRKMIQLAEVYEANPTDTRSAKRLIDNVESLGLIPINGTLTMTPNSPMDVLISGVLSQNQKRPTASQTPASGRAA